MFLRDVIGQNELKQRIIQKAQEGKISHAQLFFGKSGSGNLPLALAYAQYILCLNPSEQDSCGECSACVKVQKMIHPDMHFIFPVYKKEKEKDPPVSDDYIKEFREQVLLNPYLEYLDWVSAIDIENKQAIINKEDCFAIIDKLSLKPYESKYKIMVIWLIEKLYHAAAPTLLKILEEPPNNTIFLVVSDDIENILSTILSRLQMVKLKPLSMNQITQKLATLNHDVPSQDLEFIAKISDGNFNKALKLLLNNTQEAEFDKLFIQWMRWCYEITKNDNILVLSDWIENFSKNPKDYIKSFLEYSIYVAGQCIKINQQLDALITLNKQELALYKKFSPFIHTINLPYFEEELEKALFHISRNVSVKMVLLDITIKISRIIKTKQNV